MPECHGNSQGFTVTGNVGIYTTAREKKERRKARQAGEIEHSCTTGEACRTVNA
jgi:hypothetical protein